METEQVYLDHYLNLTSCESLLLITFSLSFVPSSNISHFFSKSYLHPSMCEATDSVPCLIPNVRAVLRPVEQCAFTVLFCSCTQCRTPFCDFQLFNTENCIITGEVIQLLVLLILLTSDCCKAALCLYCSCVARGSSLTNPKSD